MLVYVINKHSKPLMPCSPAKARKLLKSGKAKVVNRTPFTIQLIYGSSGYTQPISLGVDAGSKEVGLSATTENQELYASETQLRNDIVELLSTRRELRRARRNRKTRYRPSKFMNRVHSKNKGWLAPSIEHKIQTHLKLVNKVHDILPITNTIVETAAFDIQKIKNPNISGKEYQHGE
jgi:N6-L-threonylcarbamoyladenine synthase